MQALIDATQSGAIDVTIGLVVSNRRKAYGQKRAEKARILSLYFPLKPYREKDLSRQAYDGHLAAFLAPYYPDLIVLAGWMHVLSPAFLDHFPGKVINIHPALQGEFPGIHAIERAHEAFRQGKITHTGVMVHWVVPEVDAGSVIVSEKVPIYEFDKLIDLEMRMHRVEHRLIIDAINCCI